MNSDFEKFFHEQMNHCVKCHSPREVMDFESLPADIKLGFEAKKEMAEYFLYCPECGNYAMLTKPGME